MTTIKMRQIVCFAAALLINVALSTGLRAQQLPREEWGAAPVTVVHSGANWTIAGKANRVTLNETSLALTIQLPQGCVSLLRYHGGWNGMKQLIDTCRQIGYPVVFHDQYRDYYLDAHSYNEQFAVSTADDNLWDFSLTDGRGIGRAMEYMYPYIKDKNA